jgi:cytosine/adenosine deaminase-related metal-dependent hydrolase
MRRFAAQYVITNSGPTLKRAVITTDDAGKVTGIKDTKGELPESANLEYHNGIIIPAFVNCHCHLELSHVKGAIGQGGGLGDFISQIRTTRDLHAEQVITSASRADEEMYRNGIGLCADICNTSETFKVKTESAIKYINLIEVFGIDPLKTEKRMSEAGKVAAAAAKTGLPHWLVPHSVYSMSLPLLRHLKERTTGNEITSIHFMETPGEKDLVEKHTGKLMESYRKAGLVPVVLETAKSHADAILNEVTPSGNLILVHNTYADADTIREVKKRKDLYWCLCPNSNQYIENTIPPVQLLLEEGCEIVIGTDSLASNNRLDILEEIKTLQLHFPGLSIEELVKWSTINGARALRCEDSFGKIEIGLKPGLLLLENVDLQSMKLTKETTVRRLV